ncbi:DUF2061 domain-containing protein [bacterium]|jgi:uncharacterized membrane protein|nr:DUF2061 domain-containing protein [bacterium]
MATEKRYRSIVKAFSWRVTGTLDTVLISYLITRKFDLALSIGFVELFTKMFLYYFHERIWNKLKFGLGQNKQDYQI